MKGAVQSTSSSVNMSDYTFKLIPEESDNNNLYQIITLEQTEESTQISIPPETVVRTERETKILMPLQNENILKSLYDNYNLPKREKTNGDFCSVQVQNIDKDFGSFRQEQYLKLVKNAVTRWNRGWTSKNIDILMEYKALV